MSSPHLSIRDLIDGQKQQEPARNQQIADFDRAANQRRSVLVDGDVQLTELQQKRSRLLVLTPDGVSSDFSVLMYDSAPRMIMIVNSCSQLATLKNSAGGGANQPVMFEGDKLWVYYDGSTFIELGRSAPPFPTLVSESFNYDQGLLNNFTVDIPTGGSVGDVVILGVSGGDNGNGSPGLTSDGGVMTLATASNSNGALASMHAGIWYYVLTGSDPATFDFTASNARWWSIHATLWSGLDSADPFDVGQAITSNAGTFNLSAAGQLTATNDNALGMFITTIRSSNADQSCVIAQPSDFVELLDHRDSTPSDDDARYRFTFGSKQFFTAGDIGTHQFTFGGAGGCSLAPTTVQRGVTAGALFNAA